MASSVLAGIDPTKATNSICFITISVSAGSVIF